MIFAFEWILIDMCSCSLSLSLSTRLHYIVIDATSNTFYLIFISIAKSKKRLENITIKRRTYQTSHSHLGQATGSDRDRLQTFAIN